MVLAAADHLAVMFNFLFVKFSLHRLNSGPLDGETIAVQSCCGHQFNILFVTVVVVNGIAAFSEAVTVGVPQAASPILGIYHGERDGNSIRIMLDLEWQNGLACCGVFAAAITADYKAVYGDEPACAVIKPSQGAHLV